MAMVLRFTLLVLLTLPLLGCVGGEESGRERPQARATPKSTKSPQLPGRQGEPWRVSTVFPS